MRSHDLGAAVTDFTAILGTIDFSQFERFSNVADEISEKLLSNFLDCEVLVVVLHQHDFKFSIKAVERKRWTEVSTHIQEI